MKRRAFLQFTGMSAAASMLAACRKGNEKLIPFLIPPEDGSVPGTATYYASACRQCPAGCGVLVRVSEGRAKKVEGNPRHPLNQGKLCARGQAMVQDHYHPDRIRQPLKRSGPRGSDDFIPISWEEGLKILLDDLAALQQQGTQQKLALFTAPLQGSLAVLADEFRTAFGGGRHLAWDLLYPEWQSHGLFGHLGTRKYDIANCQYLLSFGADLLESHQSPVHYGLAFGRMRQARPTVRGRFTYLGPRLSMTAASADRWLPTRPGTEWIMAFGIIHRLLKDGHHDAAMLGQAGISVDDLRAQVAPYDAARVAELTGVNQADIEAGLREASSIRPALAVPGTLLGWQSNGSAATAAVDLLNLVLGNINRPGGLQFYPRSGAVKASPYTDLLDSIKAMRRGDVSLALIHGVNPIYNLPATLGFHAALERVPRVVSFASILDDTARQADLILPDHSNLESWGDVIPAEGTAGGVIGLMQPVVKPLHDTRAFADVLLALSQALKPATDASGAENYQQWLENYLLEQIPVPTDTTPQAFRDRLFQHGGWFEAAPEMSPLSRLHLPGRPSDAVFVDPGKNFPLHLQLYPSPSLYDGRSSHLPWLQQLPDPMTTAVWGSWLELNPQTAARLEIGEGDLVEVSSTRGKLVLPVFFFPGIRPDVVACPMGQGHRGQGRYADGRGTNPMQLLAELNGKQPQLPAWGGTIVNLRRISAGGQLVTAGHIEGSYRQELLGL